MTHGARKKVEQLLHKNYQKSFSTHGPTIKGLDWEDEKSVLSRYSNMLKLITNIVEKDRPFTILDVGCGYARFYEYLSQHLPPNLFNKMEYTGVDVVEEMVQFCKETYPQLNFYHKSVFELDLEQKYDFVVCNGILTKKCASTQPEMDNFTNELIKTIFAICNRGIYFNLFSNQVNWFHNENYYRSPVETLCYCLQLTPYVILDHTIPRYEYAVYLYKEVDSEKI